MIFFSHTIFFFSYSKLSCLLLLSFYVSCFYLAHGAWVCGISLVQFSNLLKDLSEVAREQPTATT